MVVKPIDMDFGCRSWKVTPEKALTAIHDDMGVRIVSPKEFITTYQETER